VRTNMLKATRTETSTGRIIWVKELTDNWWQVYHDICIFSWGINPKYFKHDGEQVSYRDPSAVKMECRNRIKNRTIFLERV
jgi:hypothetical protein